MKKMYIRPEVEFEEIEVSNIMESSWEYKGNDFTGGTGGGSAGLDGELSGGDGSDFAKEAHFEFTLDI